MAGEPGPDVIATRSMDSARSSRIAASGLVRTLLGALAFVGVAWVVSACTNEDGACKDDFDCDGSTVCRLSTGTCEPFVCNTNSDCTGGLTCDDNLCH